MQSRVAIWQSMLSLLSWKLPFGDVSPRELPVEVTDNVTDSESCDSESAVEKPCRSMRIFVGYKAA